MSELKRKNNFVIIDTDDKKKIIKKFQSDLSTSILANEISKMKNSLVSVDDAFIKKLQKFIKNMKIH